VDTIIYGADTETLNGEPLSLQFYSEQTAQKCERIYFVDAKSASRVFFAWLDSLARSCQHVVYVHNLDFDLPEFLWSYKDKLITVTGGEYEFTCGDWKLSGVYGTPTFCKLSNERRKSTVLIVNSFAWFKSSLAEAAKIVCPDLPKLDAPKGLGTVRFTARDAGFCAYAMRDAVVAYHIGVAVQRIHRQFDIRQSVSLADMAAKIFRHHFLTYTIPQPSRDVVFGAWKSYHGGKNNVVKGAAPAWHLGVSSMDISSAYPYAMSVLPSFGDERLYKRMPLAKRAPRDVEPFGVYQVSGTAEASDWPVLFTHGFEPIEGKFADTWVQGFELAEALRSGKVKVSRIRGHYYNADKDNRESALRAFVLHFYDLKQREKDPVLRYMYKIILNALYGKFIQTRKSEKVILTDIDANETVEASEVVAGGMFHPFIASAITAHTRAYMHRIEYAHKAFHTATDGIFTRATKPKRIAGFPTRGLGALTLEYADAELCLLRNKCYILYHRDGKLVSQFFKGKRIAKYAKHGFQGTVYDLERMIAHGGRRYTASRPNRLREALKRGLRVNEFVTRPYVLKVGKIKVSR
jgi:hypothetical protein